MFFVSPCWVAGQNEGVTRPLRDCVLSHLVYQGAATAVWLGRWVGADEPVAIKVAADPTDPAVADRLRAEAEGAGALDHPGLLAPLAVVEDPPGVAVVYPFLAGGSLRDLLEHRGALTAGELAAVLAPLAEALVARGVPHGDLKPANVLLRSDGSPVVADPAPPGGATPAYLAPEIEPGSAPTTAGDVYSLGVVAYEAISGRRPHRGEPAEVRALAAAGAHRLLTTWPGVARPVAELIEAALAPDPVDRPSDASVLAAGLVALVEPDELRLPRPAARSAVDDGADDRTLDFGPGPPEPTTDRGARGRGPMVLAGAAAIAIAGVALWGPVQQGSGCGPVEVDRGAGFVAVDLDADGCDEPVRWDGEVLAPLDRSAGGRALRIGGPGVEVRFGDWDGDGATTVAAYEPAVGVVRYLDRLDRPDLERRVPAPRSGRAEVVRDPAGDHVEVRRR